MEVSGFQIRDCEWIREAKWGHYGGEGVIILLRMEQKFKWKGGAPQG